MIYLDQPILEPWNPSFAGSGRPNPDWTRLRCGPWLLSNSLEATEWTGNPVQVVVCDACGHAGCASGGYVHMSRTPSFVVWTVPQLEDPDPIEFTQYRAAYPVRMSAVVLIDRDRWDAWAGEWEGLPRSSDLPDVTGRTLSDAWRRSMPVANRAPVLEQVPDFIRDRARASDTAGVPEIASVLRALVADFTACMGKAIAGDVVRTSRRPETIYFDAPAGDEWPAVHLEERIPMVALGSDWVFRREPRSETPSSVHART